MRNRRHGGATPDSLTGIVVAAGGVALSLLAVPLVLTAQRPTALPAASPAAAVAVVAESYLEAWERSDLTAMTSMLATTRPDSEALHQQIWEQLQVSAARFRAGEPEISGDGASVPFEATLVLAGLGIWQYDGRLQLVLAVREPLSLRTAPVVDEMGDSPPATSTEDPVLEAVAPEEPRWSVAWSPATIHPALSPGESLLSVRQTQERAALLGVGGTPLTGEHAPDLPALSSHVLGRVAALDASGAAALGHPYLPGDHAGVSGLQSAYEPRLGGRPSGEVRIVDDDGALVEVVHVFPGEAPVPVQTTFDAEVQMAAEAALAGLSQPAALVAIDAPTGEVRAVANRPTTGFNRAMVGQYPPGSTFKVVTATALLGAGVTPGTEVSCPARASVDGYLFSNAGGEVLGDIPFGMAFYRSCNTAFVQLVDELEADRLLAAAESYGFNADFHLPVEAHAGSFPEPSGPVERASAAIGQGRVTATPLQMAGVAAAVASGTWHPPTVGPPAGPTEGPPPASRPLPLGVAATLRELMLRVVEEGTGTAARLSGQPVGGKTGTAEFGTANPPATHAWFIGFRGDLALAVVVEGGGFGGSVAAPVARGFFAAVD